MTQHPFDWTELGRRDPELDRVAAGLERYAATVAAEPPADLVARVRDAVDAEPIPRRPFAAFATWAGPIRAIGTAGLAALVLAGAIAVGQLVQDARQPGGPGPTPSPSPTPSATPTPSPTPSPTPTESPSPSPSPSQTDGPGQSDEAVDTPEPAETPRPDGSDNSGPGGGGSSGSDNSGPGGGSDNSGPGGGGGSGSGSSGSGG